MAIEPFGESTIPARVLSGDHSVKRQGSVIRCTSPGCGWHVAVFPGLEEFSEEAAWMHISKPSLLLPGTSDMTIGAKRRARMAGTDWERRN